MRRMARAVSGFFRRYAAPIRVVLLVAIVLFAVYAIASSWDRVEQALSDMGPGLILGSSLVLVASIAGHYVSWLAVLAALGAPRMPVLASMAISTTSQVAKYMPGSVWTAVVQADLGRRHGIQRRLMLASYGLVLLVSVATASVLSLLVLAGPSPLWIRLVSIAAAVCGLVLLASLFHPRLLHSLLDKAFRRFSGEGMPDRIDPRGLAVAIAAVAVAWSLAGVQAWMLAEPLGATAAEIPFTAGAMLSWAVGLVIVVLPAGAGAREAILVVTLGQIVGTTEALTIALITRFLQIIVELVLAALLGLPYAAGTVRSRRRSSTD
jgi:uncharacterized membrane protein YbhN (UPF0104 family)